MEQFGEYVSKVRPYTAEERKEVRPKEGATPDKKFERIARTHEIDTQRYREAAEAHPDMKEHFDRLIDVGERAVQGWAVYYGVEAPTTVIAEAETRSVVPYAGTEPVVQDFPAREVSEQRYFIPA